MAMSQKPRHDILLGSWSLLECKTTDLNGKETNFPMGQSPRGLLMYTTDGYMSAQLLSQSPETRPSTEFSVTDFVAYSGRFEVVQLPKDGNCLRVNHLVAVASFPDWIGQVQSRIARFNDEEGLMELSTASPIFLAGRQCHATLQWRKSSTAGGTEASGDFTSVV
ncbi:hypothetical protein P170DRAFT_424060 [Aspergillus steynii IBT 23096]|uniref:Lipocalin-like domain-containing protein n=1 Tax=Aspergillus steynii IBT 23096 TaxID=1392250 RepID=A0A2I2GK95_9EURO|nr:uncharacterized protein P170DRAFT_424060 [Aspergillus steynii IBT 23096]PLB53303.1 hypothetical protein P170DRAFT_424060 [Aspergillus steynii IBT 23096]